MQSKIRILFLLACLFPLTSLGQIILTKEGKAKSRILVNKSDEVDMQAATLLHDFVKKMSGAELSIVPLEGNSAKGDIVIGGKENISLKEDGFYITTQGGNLQIEKGKGNGTIYGVVTVLEDYFGVRYYAQNSATYPTQGTLILDTNIDRIENPDFRYRQTQAYSEGELYYKLWHRLESPREAFANNLWVHTFDRLLPSKEFGATHPEYYAMINGEHRPGWASQWCLTNSEVFEIVSHRVDSIFKAYPENKMMSISQNDGHDTYCTCANCTEMNEREGSLSGSIIWFMNKLAERFPDKEFSTLAYMYSVAPPKYIKPLPNVNIMLCNIECSREVTLPENEEGAKFVKHMKEWAKITDNIFVWDYGIDFDQYLSPFPNFHVLKSNMQLFKENKTTMHFSQIAGSKGGDFSELRSYLVAKLMWNTSIDSDSLVQEFLKGYYGEPAAPYLYEYIKLREGALMGSNIPLKLYDTPVSHKHGMLNKPMLKRYIALFDKAEEVSKDSPQFLNRVMEARLPIQYSELEIAHTNVIDNPKELRVKLDFFRKRAKEQNVTILNEQSAILNDYCDLYIERYLTPDTKNLAKGAKINYLVQPTAPFDLNTDKALTDGILGANAPSDEWIGWQGKDGEFVIDLGEEKAVERVDIDFLQRLGSWAILPKGATWSTSLDGKTYTLAGNQAIAEDRDFKAKFVKTTVQAKGEINTRYIKVYIESIGLCPSWHLAVGHPAWFLIDEVSVY